MASRTGGFRSVLGWGLMAGCLVVTGCGDETASPSAGGNPGADTPPPLAPTQSSSPTGTTTTTTTGTTGTKGAVVSTETLESTPEEIVAAGRSVYNANCIACHSIDPTQDGALGPAVSGSSLELVTARVVHGKYPEGYEPKRPSRVMIALPHLESKLPELAAYLNSF